MSAALENRLMIWDTWSGNKVSSVIHFIDSLTDRLTNSQTLQIQMVPLKSSWMMSCCFSPTGNYVATGGMDNSCTVYDVHKRCAVNELSAFEGYLSCVRFIDDTQIITSSADQKM